MREKAHISVVLNINLLKIMNQVISPQTKYGDFVLTFSNLDAKNFQREYDKTKVKFSNGILITTKDQKKQTIRDWKWPEAKLIQSQFQMQVMEFMTGNHDHTKEPLVEVLGEILGKVDLSELQIQTIPEIQPILFISYKPSLIWSDQTKPVSIQF
jgi:hypothetical protein